MAALGMRPGRPSRWTVLLTPPPTTVLRRYPNGRGQRLWAVAWQERVTLRTTARVA